VTRTVYPGGLYVSALPSGEFVILYPEKRIQTHLGDIPMPPGEAYGPMFLDCSRVPEFRFTGLAHDTNGRQWEWTASRGWQAIPFITGRTAYDHFGNVRDFLPAGVQFVSDAGVPISRVDTYGPFHGLSEWSETAGLYIGQGHELSGVQVWDGQNLHTLDTGYCVFIRVHRDGEQVAIAYHREGAAVIVQTTLAELRALPFATVPTPGTDIPNPGTPEPPKPPMSDYPLPEAVYNVVLRMAEKFPELRKGDDEQRRAFTLRVAQQVKRDFGPAWGTKRADPGRPSSKDAIARKTDALLVSWDLINGSTREVHPAPIMGEDISDQVFVAVDPVDHLGSVPVPDPPPSVPQPDYAEQIADLKAQIAALLIRVLDVQQTAVKASTDASYARGQVQGIQEALPKRLANLKVRGTNGRSWSHSHIWSGEVYEE
jgi:hypothetical protein